MLSVDTHGLGFSAALMKSCEAVALDVRSHKSLNCYHTALTPLATGYTQILACTVNKLLGHIVYVLLLICVCVCVACVVAFWLL